MLKRTKNASGLFCDAAWTEYAARRTAEVKAKNEAMDSALFGEPRGMGDSPYAAPAVYPVKGQHPRIMLNEAVTEDIRALLNDGRYADLAEKFRALAQTEYGDPVNDAVRYLDGVFQEESNAKGRFRYNGNILAILEAKAMAYLLTGEEIYGYEAILGIKNAMLTLDYTTAVHMDVYHGASHIIITLAMIFDWCHDLLTDKDKKELIGGTVHLLLPQLEMHFPPANMNAVSGHGTGPQFFRDYTSIALSFYDECPDWWEYVGGRLCQEYIPVLEHIYREGWVSQGASCYAPLKYYNHAWSAWVVEHACGKRIFPQNMVKAPYFLLSELLPNGKFFPSGDGTVRADGMTGPSCQPLYFAAAISRDVGIMNYTYNTTNRFSAVHNGSVMTLSPTIAMILASQCPKSTSDNPFDGLNLIRYTGFPGNILTARNGWTEDSAVAWMKCSEMTMANHDHQDIGTFQLYYKGLITLSTGSYRRYGSDHFRYYHQATLGHNGLLVYDPSLRSDARKSDGTPADPAAFYYTGGQKPHREAGALEKWLSGDWDTAVETGHASGYTADGRAEYAYLAADITKAYDAQTVRAAERRMLSVFTDDEKIPMLFFVYDAVDTVRAACKKTFLLHAVQEPIVDAETRTVICDNKGGGRLVMQSVLGDDLTVEAIGGAGRAYEVNGVNLYDFSSDDDNADQIWGRVEISTAGEEHGEMLHALYVTDASNTDGIASASRVENAQTAGCVLLGKAVIFVRSAERDRDRIRFETAGSDSLRYYVSGIAAGTWTIRADGREWGTVTVSETENLAVFTAPAAQIELERGQL